MGIPGTEGTTPIYTVSDAKLADSNILFIEYNLYEYVKEVVRLALVNMIISGRAVPL